MSRAQLIREPDARREKHSWGELRWYCDDEEGQSKDMTFARCHILPDCKTQEHHHPDSEEIVHVLDGIVRHHMAGEKDFLELTPGDTIVAPPKAEHQIENIGDEKANLVLVWSSAGKDISEK